MAIEAQFLAERDQHVQQLNTLHENQEKLKQLEKLHDPDRAIFFFMSVFSFIPIVRYFVDVIAYNLGMIPVRTMHQRTVTEAVCNAINANESLVHFYEWQCKTINICAESCTFENLAEKIRSEYDKVPEDHWPKLSELLQNGFANKANELIADVKKYESSQCQRWSSDVAFDVDESVRKLNEAINVLNLYLGRDAYQKPFLPCKATQLGLLSAQNPPLQRQRLMELQCELQELNQNLMFNLNCFYHVRGYTFQNPESKQKNLDDQYSLLVQPWLINKIPMPEWMRDVPVEKSTDTP